MAAAASGVVDQDIEPRFPGEVEIRARAAAARPARRVGGNGAALAEGRQSPRGVVAAAALRAEM